MLGDLAPEKAGISIHAPRMGSDTTPRRRRCVPFLFQSTLPGWGATDSWRLVTTIKCKFQSTLPGWGATCSVLRGVPDMMISIHAPRMGSDGMWDTWLHRACSISIHAPRMGSDIAPAGLPHPCEISIHAPRMGSDKQRRHAPRSANNFNPRSPDGERPGRWLRTSTSDHFNPRSPDGERQYDPLNTIEMVSISIHAPRMGSDLRGEGCQTVFGRISIHAPRMGSDPSFNFLGGFRAYFNPRSPDGERHVNR